MVINIGSVTYTRRYFAEGRFLMTWLVIVSRGGPEVVFRCLPQFWLGVGQPTLYTYPTYSIYLPNLLYILTQPTLYTYPTYSIYLPNLLYILTQN